MEIDVETRDAQEQVRARPVTSVVIEPTDPEPGEASSSPALMGSGREGRLVLTTVPGRGAINPRVGRILLLLRGDEDQVEEAPAVRIVGRAGDADGGVEVEHVGTRPRRPVLTDDRFAVSRTEVELVGPCGSTSARLHDVSIRELRLSTNVPLEVGEAVTVRGTFPDHLGHGGSWQLRGKVVGSQVVGSRLTLVGVHVEDSQRAVATRLARWARDRGSTRTAVAAP